MEFDVLPTIGEIMSENQIRRYSSKLNVSNLR